MLAWFSLDPDAPAGAADRLLADLAQDMAARGAALGRRVVGAIQINRNPQSDCACDMDLVVLGDEEAPIRISQSLGPGASGCRLDSGALHQAAGRVQQHLPGAALVIVPKFGAQEAAGRGFRDVMTMAMMLDIPVLLHVPAAQRADFARFSGGLAQRLAPAELAAWCARQLAEVRHDA